MEGDNFKVGDRVHHNGKVEGFAGSVTGVAQFSDTVLVKWDNHIGSYPHSKGKLTLIAPTPKHEFKVGDRVCLKGIGMEGTVEVVLAPSGSCVVSFPGTHQDEFSPSQLILVPPTPIRPNDYVKVRTGAEVLVTAGPLAYTAYEASDKVFKVSANSGPFFLMAHPKPKAAPCSSSSPRTETSSSRRKTSS